MKHVLSFATVALFFFVTLIGVFADSFEVMPYGGAGWVFTAGVANSANNPRKEGSFGYTGGAIASYTLFVKPPVQSAFGLKAPEQIPLNFFAGVAYAYKPMVTSMSYGNSEVVETKDSSFIHITLGSRTSFFWIGEALKDLYLEGSFIFGFKPAGWTNTVEKTGSLV